MKPYIIVILVILLLVIAYFIWAYISFRVSSVRKKHEDKGIIADNVLEREEYRPFAEFMRPLCEWTESRQYEHWQTTSCDGLKLAADFLPNPASDLVVIMVHGYRSTPYNDFDVTAKFWYDRGYNLLLIHQRSHGRSEGRYICFGGKEQYDVDEWVKCVINHFGTNCRIFLAGVSMGAATVLMSSGHELPQQVHGVVADCGFTTPAAILSDVMRKAYHMPPALLCTGLFFLIRHIAGYNPKKASSLTALEKTRLPVLLIHGTGDNYVPHEMSVQNYAVKGKADKYFCSVDKAFHTGSYIFDQNKVETALNDFLNKYE